MSKKQIYIQSTFAGAIYGVVLIILSRCFIRNLSKIFYIIGSIMQVDAEQVTHITRALEQLGTARLVSPWIVVVLLGSIVGICYLKLISKCKRNCYRYVCVLRFQHLSYLE